MNLFGYRTIFLVLIIEIAIITSTIILRGMWQIGVPFLIVDLVLLGIIKIDSNQIKFYSLGSLFSKKRSIFLDEIEHVNIEGWKGFATGRLDIRVLLKNEDTISGFMLMYPFEKNKLVRALREKAIEVLY